MEHSRDQRAHQRAFLAKGEIYEMCMGVGQGIATVIEML
jgi:hypothetical protein